MTMSLVVEVKCPQCGCVLGSVEVEHAVQREIRGDFILKMQPPHRCAQRFSLLQKNELVVKLAEPASV